MLSFFLQVTALIFGIIALAQSRRAGVPNRFAIAGIVISIVVIVVGTIIWIAVVTTRDR